MENIQNITSDLYYIGASDRKLPLFEAVYPINCGASFNSYLLLDDKTVLFDTVDKHCCEQFFQNLKCALNNRKLDYFVINHLEPDHSALIKKVLKKYNDVKVVCSAKTKQMLYQFFEFDFDIENNFHIVKEGDTLSAGSHELRFIMAPMVHWPEVMVTYDSKDKVLFSADAFGSFGALEGNIFDDETEFSSKIDEYRRYYTNIVGKYGPQVNALLNKTNALDIKMICPLHGVILRENIGLMLKKYSLWASYRPEMRSALIVYASVYGATQNAAEVVATCLAQKGIKNIKIHDVSTTHPSYILSDAFKYSHIVVATPTYNNNIFVKMEQFISELVSHNLQNRTFAIIENGSWAPNSASNTKKALEGLKGTVFIENYVTIKSTLKQNQKEELINLADQVADDIKKGLN